MKHVPQMRCAQAHSSQLSAEESENSAEFGDPNPTPLRSPLCNSCGMSVRLQSRARKQAGSVILQTPAVGRLCKSSRHAKTLRFSFQLPVLIPSPFRRAASSRYLLCVPATLRSIGGGAGGFPCQGFDFAIGRRNRLPHQDRRVLQATFSRNPNLPALSRQSFSSAMRLPQTVSSGDIE